MEIICPCGNKIVIKYKSRIGRTKYCCKKCFYKYQPHRHGYKCVFKNGCSSWFKSGQTAWNKGQKRYWESPSFKKGEHISPATEFKKGQYLEIKNNKWKGDKVGYGALHAWVYRKLGRATECTKCHKKKLRYHWANKSHEYKRDTSDWMSLCQSCHFKYDGKTWGLATKLWNLNKK